MPIQTVLGGASCARELLWSHMASSESQDTSIVWLGVPENPYVDLQRLPRACDSPGAAREMSISAHLAVFGAQNAASDTHVFFM